MKNEVSVWRRSNCVVVRGLFLLMQNKLSWTQNARLPSFIEEAVNEVKRQAMDEVQKAVAEAEQKAFEMIAAERAKMEKTLAEAKRKAQEDAIMVINEQEDSSEVSTDV